MKKIGILGGTFNPIHNAHIIIAENFVEQIGLDTCYFVPAALSPFKKDESSAKIINDHHRLNLVQLAIEDNDSFKLEIFEIAKGGISYTYETVRYFKENFSDSRLYLLIGSDQAASFKEWSNWNQILDEVNIVIAPRHSSSDEKNKEIISKILTFRKKIPIWLESQYIDISSTNIREKIKNAGTLDNIPAQVKEYIIENNLYC